MISTGDTIVAVASPPGCAARAVLRVSGAAAVRCLDPLLGGKDSLADVRGFAGRSVRLEVDDLRIPAWVVIFRAPRSYSREDLLELHLPSSPPLLSAVSRALVLQDGVRWAGPGEFTLRAFLNGRLELSQAESVARLISAVDADEANAARRGLEGELASSVENIAKELTETIALVEAALDFPDEDLPEVAPDAVLVRLRRIEDLVDALRRSTALRLSARGVLHAVIAGLPNAGKSSLLNALLGRSAALVSDFPGTTRDPVRGTTFHGGALVEWVDVAGAHSYSGSGSLESAAGEGLERRMSGEARSILRRLTRLELEHADVVLWVLDPRSDVEASLREFRALRARRMLVVNKLDLLNAAEKRAWAEREEGVCLVSAREGRGIEELARRVVQAGRGSSEESRRLAGASPRFLVSAHQEAALLSSLDAVRRARDAVGHGFGYECAAVDLREALRALEDLTGRVTNEEILAHIFSRFCIGK